MAWPVSDICNQIRIAFLLSLGKSLSNIEIIFNYTYISKSIISTNVVSFTFDAF